MAETLEELIPIGKVPLGENAPDPKEVREESPEFERLDKEIGKLGALHADNPVDWQTVVADSSAILRDKSKNLEAAAYLCRGLWERDGYAGLRVGLTILRDIIQVHWEIAYPPKKKARIRGGKIGWLEDRLGKLLPNHKPKPEEQETVSACLDLVKEIDGLLNEKLGEHAPILRELLKALQKMLDQLRKDGKKDPKPPPPLPLPLTDFKEIKKALYQMAMEKRAEKLSDPLPYRILRFVAWMGIEKIGKVDAPGPTQGQLKECANLLEDKQYAALIETVENRFADPRFLANAYWLDAHRFTAQALEGLGMQYNEAKQTVIAELASFLRRVPGLEKLTFNDGIPFADAQTKLWIFEQVLPSPEEQPIPDSSDDVPLWMKTAKEAKQLASKGQFAEGLSLWQDGRKSVNGQREQFFWLLEQARFCYDTDHVELAIPQLEFLDTQVERFALEEWEPMLSVEVARLLLECHNKSRTQPTEKITEAKKRLYARLCRLDISAALALAKK